MLSCLTSGIQPSPVVYRQRGKEQEGEREGQGVCQPGPSELGGVAMVPSTFGVWATHLPGGL